jgi:hypothetical protein
MDVLLDTIQPYPTFSEAIFGALRELEERLRDRGTESPSSASARASGDSEVRG